MYKRQGPGNASELLSTYMYKKAFSNNQYGYGSALAVFIIIESMLVVFIPVSYTHLDVYKRQGMLFNFIFDPIISYFYDMLILGKPMAQLKNKVEEHSCTCCKDCPFKYMLLVRCV